MMNELERLIPLIETAIDNGASIPGLATMNRAKELVKAVKMLKDAGTVTNMAKKPVKKCSACGAVIRTSILRQCEKCIKERRGL